MLDWTLQWRHNERYGVSNHRRFDCLLNRLFMRWSKKTSKLRVIGLWRGIHWWPVNSPYKGLVTRKMFSFHYVIIIDFFHLSCRTAACIVSGALTGFIQGHWFGESLPGPISCPRIYILQPCMCGCHRDKASMIIMQITHYMSLCCDIHDMWYDMCVPVLYINNVNL